MSKMSARSVQRRAIPDQPDVDARVGNRLIEVKFGVDALRTIRTSLMQLAYAVAEEPAFKGFLVLVDSTITEKRLRDEWQAAWAVLRPEIMKRVTVCLTIPARRDWRALSKVTNGSSTGKPASSQRVYFANITGHTQSLASLEIAASDVL